MVAGFFTFGTLCGMYPSSFINPTGGSTTMKKITTVAVAALVALSLSATAFAATKTQSQSGTRTQIKSGICVK